MPPKAQKTPTTGGKAPAGKAPAEKKEAGKKTAAPSGDKKKRTKTRKETYSSYIYKGEFGSLSCASQARHAVSAVCLWP
jgi:histone H2B